MQWVLQISANAWVTTWFYSSWSGSGLDLLSSHHLRSLPWYLVFSHTLNHIHANGPQTHISCFQFSGIPGWCFYWCQHPYCGIVGTLPTQCFPNWVRWTFPQNLVFLLKCLFWFLAPCSCCPTQKPGISLISVPPSVSLSPHRHIQPFIRLCDCYFPDPSQVSSSSPSTDNHSLRSDPHSVSSELSHELPVVFPPSLWGHDQKQVLLLTARVALSNQKLILTKSHPMSHFLQN